MANKTSIYDIPKHLSTSDGYLLGSVVAQVLKERMAELEKEPLKIDLQKDVGITRQRLPFLDLLLSQSEAAGFSFQDIQEEVDTFMFEVGICKKNFRNL